MSSDYSRLGRAELLEEIERLQADNERLRQELLARVPESLVTSVTVTCPHGEVWDRCLLCTATAR